MKSSSLITAETLQTFDEVGVVAVRKMVSACWLDLLNGGIDQLIATADDYSDYYDSGDLTTTSADAAQREQKSGQSLTRQNGWIISTQLRRLLIESPLAKGAAKLVGR